MDPLQLELAVIGLFVGLLLFLSAVESALSQLSAVDLKLLAEKMEGKSQILNLASEDRLQILIPLHLGTQVSLLTISILVTHLLIEHGFGPALPLAFLVMSVVVLLFRQIIPKLLTAWDPEAALLLLLPAFKYPYGLLRSLALPISSALRLIKQRKTEAEATAGEETTEEEIQAYLDVGEEEGIIEESDSELIQSAVEFGDALVKEVMTPRTEILAISEKASLRELRSLMVRSKHSRIPVFRDQPDNFVGIAFIKNLLAVLDEGSGDRPVSEIMQPVRYVPETKRAAELLREMQMTGEHMAIVVDEFGGVAGLVTLEDLLELLVGEIRDEGELPEAARDGTDSYLLRGNAELRAVEDLFGISLNGIDAATVAGLIINLLGRVPAVGEKIEHRGLMFEVVEGDRQRVRRLRVRKLAAEGREPKEGAGS